MFSLPLYRFKSISEFHRFRKIPGPAHPLISLFNIEFDEDLDIREPFNMVFDFYSIGLKRDFEARMHYGQQEYDFQNGGLMTFVAPGQVFRIETAEGHGPKSSGWVLMVHPDFLWNTHLAKEIRKYEYFDYAVHEALFLSDKEEDIITGVLRQIADECKANLDKYSQNIIIAQLELLLSYAERFYQRQFITRKISNHQVLEALERVLDDYFKAGDLTSKGLPTVQYVADKLNMSQGYLTGLLKMLTGQNTQQHIHERVIEMAKQKLSATQLSVSEIAYVLGFEHSQSFSKLFRQKTNQSPLAFRKAFN